MGRTLVEKVCQECQDTFMIALSDVNRGRGRFCGKSCSKKGSNNNQYRHGNAIRKNRTRTYRSWASMQYRVRSNTYHAKHRYAERGIKVCERWNSFENFVQDMGERPVGTTLDRIDNNGNYEMTNCRWATKNQQANNSSNNKSITYNGVTMNQEQWGRVTGLGGLTIHKRIKRGWSIKDTLTKPNQKI